jgi:type IV pilus assembly protein PilY1
MYKEVTYGVGARPFYDLELIADGKTPLSMSTDSMSTDSMPTDSMPTDGRHNLKAILPRIFPDSYMAGAPVFLPHGLGAGKGAALYFHTYKIRTHDQWEGWFTKYDLPTGDGSLEKVWELNDGSLLRQARAGSRNVYTVGGAGRPDTSSIINIQSMSPASFADLVDLPRASLDKATNFQEWLFRYDYDPTSQTGSILGDMPHSGFAVLDEPDTGTRIASKGRTLYLQTNRGVLHAVDDASGEEVWAFIPPNVFQGRLKTLKFTAKNEWIKGDGISTVNSTPMTLLDGGVVTQDVRFSDNGYHTVLVGNLGWGGNGLYAMDVTERFAEPRFLWAVDNARYEKEAQPLTNGVYLWGRASGPVTADGPRDYSDLGLTIVPSTIVSVPRKTISGAGEVGLLAGGLRQKQAQTSQGKVLYVFEPENGMIWNILDEEDFIDPTMRRTRSLGMMMAPLSYVSDKNTRLTESFYTADSNGNVLFCDTTLPVEQWKLRSVFQLSTKEGVPISISKALLVLDDIQKQERWVVGGTADLMLPFQKKGVREKDVREMKNPSQYVFALNTHKTSGDLTAADLFELPYVEDSIEGTYGRPLDEFTPANADAWGWVLPLRPKTGSTEAEYVSTSPYLYSGVLYVSTFIPSPIPEDMANLELCPELGDSKIYALNPVTGEGKWEGGEQAVVLKNVKISGLSAFEQYVYVGFKPFNSEATLAPGEGVLRDYRLVGLEQNIGRFRAILEKFQMEEPAQAPQIQYWKEEF